MISTRPIHISAIITPFERPLKLSYEPSGPAKPNAGPTLPSVAAAAPIASNGREDDVGAERVEHERERPDREQAQVEQHEREHRLERLLVDHCAVQPDRRDHLGVHGLLELAAEDPADQHVTDDLDRLRPSSRPSRR